MRTQEGRRVGRKRKLGGRKRKWNRGKESRNPGKGQVRKYVRSE